MRCGACGSPVTGLVYESREGRSVTSLAHILAVRTSVFLCTTCGHLQTKPLEDPAAYYDNAYGISTASEDDDQLYAVEGDELIYRTRHQFQVLSNKLDLPPGTRLLDYGSGKARSVQFLAEARPDVQVHVFDISQDYVDFWKRYLEPDRWSCYRPKDEWRGYFDVVLSFFALEHADSPAEFLAGLTALVRPGGTVYLVFPNPYGGNASDVVVVDHINHFSEHSLRVTLARAGLEILEIDTDAHDLAYIVTARYGDPVAPLDPADPRGVENARALAAFWSDAADAVADFGTRNDGPAAIYGAGIVGSFIATSLVDAARLVCFVDRNPFKHGWEIVGAPVVGPDDPLVEQCSVVYLGLNPGRGPEVLEAVSAWKARQPEVFVLPHVPSPAG